MTVTEFAEKFGVSTSTARAWARDGIVRAEKIGPIWVIDDKAKPPTSNGKGRPRAGRVRTR